MHSFTNIVFKPTLTLNSLLARHLSSLYHD